MIDKQYIEEIISCAKRMDEKNLVNAFEGNISAKHDHLIYITPTGKNKAFLTPNMIAVIDEEGHQVAGDCKPTSELPMHLQTYTIRDNIAAVVHSHAPYLTAHSLAHKPVSTRAYPELIGNFLEIPVCPYGRPGTPAILEPAIPILKEGDIVILGNHGVLAVGASVTEAMNKVEAAEAIAKTLFLTNALGKEAELSESEIKYLQSCYYEKRG